MSTSHTLTKLHCGTDTVLSSQGLSIRRFVSLRQIRSTGTVQESTYIRLQSTRIKCALTTRIITTYKQRGTVVSRRHAGELFRCGMSALLLTSVEGFQLEIPVWRLGLWSFDKKHASTPAANPPPWAQMAPQRTLIPARSEIEIGQGLPGRRPL